MDVSGQQPEWGYRDTRKLLGCKAGGKHSWDLSTKPFSHSLARGNGMKDHSVSEVTVVPNPPGQCHMSLVWLDVIGVVFGLSTLDLGLLFKVAIAIWPLEVDHWLLGSDVRILLHHRPSGCWHVSHWRHPRCCGKLLGVTKCEGFEPLKYGYGSIPIDTFLGGCTSIYQLFWGSPGVQGFDTLPYLGISWNHWKQW